MIPIIIIEFFALSLLTLNVSGSDATFPYWSILNDPNEHQVNRTNKCEEVNRIIFYWSLRCTEVPFYIIATNLSNFPVKHKVLQEFNCTECALSEFNNKLFNNKSTDLNYMSLINTRLNHLSDLTFQIFENLVELVIENAFLTEYDASIFPSKVLRKLTVRVNNFPEITDAGRFDNLDKLDLSSNKIYSFGSDAFKNLPKLSHLDISNNLLKTLPDKLFEGVPNLAVLNIHHNRLMRLSDSLFISLHNLIELDFSYNPMFDIQYQDVFLRKLKTVEVYRLDGLPCTSLKFKLLDYIQIEFYQLPEKHQMRELTFILKSDLDVYNSSQPLLHGTRFVEHRIKPDVRKRFWYESARKRIKCLNFFNHNWSTNLKVQNLTITEYNDHLLSVILKLRKKNVFSIELNTLMEAVHNFKERIQKYSARLTSEL